MLKKGDNSKNSKNSKCDKSRNNKGVNTKSASENRILNIRKVSELIKVLKTTNNNLLESLGSNNILNNKTNLLSNKSIVTIIEESKTESNDNYNFIENDDSVLSLEFDNKSSVSNTFIDCTPRNKVSSILNMNYFNHISNFNSSHNNFNNFKSRIVNTDGNIYSNNTNKKSSKSKSISSAFLESSNLLSNKYSSNLNQNQNNKNSKLNNNKSNNKNTGNNFLFEREKSIII